MKILLRVFLVAASWLAGAAAGAAATIQLVPTVQSVPLGGTFDVDVVVSGLDSTTPSEVVSSFDLVLLFDAALIGATDLTFGPDLGDPLTLEVLQFSDLSAPGEVHFLALSLLSDAALDGLQGDSVVLATVVFEAVALGASPLTILLDATHQVVGRDGLVLDLVAETATVTVVPEPSTAALLIVSAVAAAIRLKTAARVTVS